MMIYGTLSTPTVLWIACASKLPLGQERQHQNLYLCGLNDDEATKKYPSKAVFKCVCLPEKVAEKGICSGQNRLQVTSNILEFYLYICHKKLRRLSYESLVQKMHAGLATERSQVHTASEPQKINVNQTNPFNLGIPQLIFDIQVKLF